MHQCFHQTASTSASPAAAQARELDLLPPEAFAAAEFWPKLLALLCPAAVRCITFCATVLWNKLECKNALCNAKVYSKVQPQSPRMF